MATPPTARVLVMTPDSNAPIGGVKVHYQVVDALNRAGIDALVVHRTPFRCTWFQNRTPVIDLSHLRVDARDVLVVPEEWTAFIPGLPAHVPKAVFHQNTYTTFTSDLPWDVVRDVWSRPDVRRIVVVSEDNAAFVRYGFPALEVARVRPTIEPDPFSFVEATAKKRQIAYMPRKRSQEANDVLSLLRTRGALEGWEVVPIVGMSEPEVASTLRDSAFFLAFSEREGLGLPPAEAMACGCLVIGFHGFGGRELGDHAEWVPEGDVVAYARAVEAALRRWDGGERSEERTRAASAHTLATYSATNLTEDARAAFGFSTEGVVPGAAVEVPDAMWQVLPLARRMVRRSARAVGVLRHG